MRRGHAFTRDHPTFAETASSWTKSVDMRVGIRQREGFLSSLYIFSQVGIDGRKLVVGNSSHIDNICPRRASFSARWAEGREPDGVSEAK